MNYFQGLRRATDKESRGSIRFAGQGAGQGGREVQSLNYGEAVALCFG